MSKLTQKLKNYKSVHLNSRVHAIKYFHPERHDMPNGVYVQKGGFLNQCYKNENSFKNDGFDYALDNNGELRALNKPFAKDQVNGANRKGGILIFPAKPDAEQLTENQIFNTIKQLIKSLDTGKDNLRFAFAIGHFFTGSYTDSHNTNFNKDSKTVDLGGISTADLLQFAEHLCDALSLETVLVKDGDSGKFYGVEGE